MVCVGVPWTVFLLLVLLFFFLRLRSIFLTCSREAKRLEAVARSHVYAHYAATIQVRVGVRVRVSVREWVLEMGLKAKAETGTQSA